MTSGHEWTDHELALVKKQWVAGRSAAQISRELPGRSRASVIGIVHRKGWAGLRGTATAPSAVASLARTSKQAGAIDARGNRRPRPVDGLSAAELAEQQAKRQKFEAAGKATIAAVDAAANDGCIPLIERRTCQCAYPMGVPIRPAQQLCCGQPVAVGAGRAVPSYCDQHAREALAAVQPKRKVPTEPSIKRRAA